jgi:hypothetical protein
MTAVVETTITYEQVARWLPVQIRREIEEVVPCHRGAEHRWDDEDPYFTKRPGFDKSKYRSRECMECGVRRRNPDFRRRQP